MGQAGAEPMDCGMAKKQKGQAAVEAMAYIGMFLFITVFFSIFLLQQQAAELREREYRLSTQVAGQISDAITIGALGGPGFNATFRIPPEIMGKMYIVNMSSTGSIFITLISPPSNFGGNNVTFYHTVGARGVIKPIAPHASGGQYTTMSNAVLDAVWFNSSRGQFRVYVNSNRDLYIG